MQKKIIDSFRIEDNRDLFARKKMFTDFRRLYSKQYSSIFNKNSGLMWDDINTSGLKELSVSPIYKDKLFQILKILKNGNGNLLDVGFGSGIIEEKLKNSRFSLYGIDLSKKSVKKLNLSVNGVFKTGNVLRIPFKMNYFDYALCLDILEHISPFDTFKALREVKRVLKINSCLIISIPLNEGLEKMLTMGINPNAHVRAYTPKIIETELKMSGFIIEKEIYLSAFNTNYLTKKFVNQIFRIKKPNLLIIVARKI